MTDQQFAGKIDRKGTIIAYTYDHLKRLSGKGGTIPPISYSYTGQSLTSVADYTNSNPPEAYTFTYDTAYRLQSETQATRGTLTYTYNPDDTLSGYAVTGGPTATYAYYPDGSLNTIAWTPAAGNFKYQHALTGPYQSLTLPTGGTRNFTYDNQARLTQLSNLDPIAGNLATYAYGYDLNYTTGAYTRLGQRVSMTATVPSQGLNNHTTTYEYDPLYQLTKATYPNVAPFNGEVDSWTYDAIGNRLTSTVNGSTQNYTYQKIGANPNNWQRLLSDGVNSYTYDANGNVATMNGGSGSLTLGWDQQDRLASISGSTTAAYVYDFQGRRSYKTVGGTTYSYAYDGLNELSEGYAATGGSFLFGPGTDEPLAQLSNGQLYYYGTDALGSVTTVTDPSGTVQSKYLTDAWGTSRSVTEAIYNPFLYTAREKGEAGSLFYRARFYLPAVGRFLSEDPLARRLSRSLRDLYRYARNSPLAYVDPTGLRNCKLTVSRTLGQRLKSLSYWTVWAPDGTPDQEGGEYPIFWVLEVCHWVRFYIEETWWEINISQTTCCDCPYECTQSYGHEMVASNSERDKEKATTYGLMILGRMRGCLTPDGRRW